MPDISEEITQVRRFLKERLQRDYTTLRGHESERENIRKLVQNTAELGESNSLLLIGPRGAGKTTLVNAIITDLLTNDDFVENTLIVHLNGNIHTDDRLALKSATVQMQLENAVDGKVFGSFAENLAFLLACLKSGSKRSKSVLFILEEFDLFCTHHNQTLLYNLFDVAQSAQAPLCVIGITCRLDVMELLEKRVKSRFSHRQVFLFPYTRDFDRYSNTFQELLSIPTEADLKKLTERLQHLKKLHSEELSFHLNHFNPTKYKLSKRFSENWNKSIAALLKENAVMRALHSLHDFDVTEAFLRVFLLRLVAQLNEESQHQISAEQVSQLAAKYDMDDKVELLLGLSVLELCLVIAMKHHAEIYDRDPFNFEIIFARFNKFAKLSTTMQTIDRAVVLKAFEHLRNLELILPLTGGGCKVQKEFEMHRLCLIYEQINDAVQRYQALPTEVSQWAQSSLI